MNRSKNKSLLLVIDFGECFSKSRELNDRIASIERVQDEKVYGLFEAFCSYMEKDLIELAAQKLKDVSKETVKEMVNGIPSEWQVAPEVKKALVDLIFSRAHYLADNIPDKIINSKRRLF